MSDESAVGTRLERTWPARGGARRGGAVLEGSEGEHLDAADGEGAAEEVVSQAVIPGYEGIIALFENMALTANHDAGVWRLPDGEAIYKDRLLSSTSTDYSPEEIHNTGLSEVAPVAQTFFADPYIQMHAQLDCVVTVVDAPSCLSILSKFSPFIYK